MQEILHILMERAVQRKGKQGKQFKKQFKVQGSKFKV